MIPPDTIALIKQTASITEVISDFIALKQRGASFIACCPFHNEKTPSFHVTPSKGIFKCYGCGKSGDAIQFIIEHEKLPYPDALRHIARKYNIPIQEKTFTPEDAAHQDARNAQLGITQFAANYYHQNLLNTTHALNYLTHTRHWTPATITQFNLGYAPPEWNTFTKHATAQQYPLPLLIDSGLTILKPADNQYPEQHYDRFRNRITIPIQKITGNTISFGARLIEHNPKYPKYLNGPETEIYNKTHTLFALNHAGKAIIQHNICHLVEGYADAISFHQADITNTVASCGTSLTIHQCALIRRFTNNINIIFDHDTAGIKAAIRSYNILLSEGFNTYITLLPPNQDPDSFAINHTPQQITEYITQHKQDFIHFRLSLLTHDELTQPIPQTTAITELLQTINLIPDNLLQHQYIIAIANRFNIPPQTLTTKLNSLKSPNEPHPQSPIPNPQSPIPTFPSHEANILRLLINHGDTQITHPTFTGTVRQCIIAEIQIDEIIIHHPLMQTLYNYYCSSLLQSCEQITNELTHSPSSDIRNTVTSLIYHIPHFAIPPQDKNKSTSPTTELQYTLTTALLYLKLHHAKYLKSVNTKKINTRTASQLTPTTIQHLQIQNQLNQYIIQISRKLGIAVLK